MDFAVVIARTSNLFSSTYEVYVKRDDAESVEKGLAILGTLLLTITHRDEERLELTALTGKDEFDGRDRLLLEAWRRLKAGESPEEVERDIIRRMGVEDAQDQ
ncbi:MAG: hypothetical protein QXI32_00860 [Candidatus Bathyarchaeia archaeon]